MSFVHPTTTTTTILYHKIVFSPSFTTAQQCLTVGHVERRRAPSLKVSVITETFREGARLRLEITTINYYLEIILLYKEFVQVIDLFILPLQQ